MSQKVTITDDVTGYEISYNNSYGTTIPMDSSSVYNFGSGPFDPYITPN